VGGGLGVKPNRLPFWLCIVTLYIYIYIYIYIYNMFVPPVLAVWLDLYPNDLIMDRFGVVRQIWWTRQTIFFQFFAHGVSLGISRLPRGTLLLGHVAASHLFAFLPSKSARHDNVQTVTWHDLIGPRIGPKMPKSGDTWHDLIGPRIGPKMPKSGDTWHDLIGPRIGPKMPKLGDTWQHLVLPHHHEDINMPCVTFLLLPCVLYRC
jgi:hypothetical protein